MKSNAHCFSDIKYELEIAFKIALVSLSISKQLMQKYLSNTLNDKHEVNSLCPHHAILDFVTFSYKHFVRLPKIFTG